MINVCQYFLESFGIVHFLMTLLITVPLRQNHRRVEKSSMILGGFLNIFK